MPRDRQLSTSYPRPYALIQWGGVVAGQRPRTKLAFVRCAVAVEGKIVQLRCRVRLGAKWSNSDYSVTPEHVVQTWRHWPTEAALRRAKQGVSKADTTQRVELS